MILTNKLLPVALIAALVGGSVGALVMHSRNQTTSADTTATTAASNQTADASKADEGIPAEFNTPAEQTAYKSGFADGFQAADQVSQKQQSSVSTGRTSYVSRNVVRRSAPRRVYYDYSKPQGRSFWQKHRDKLTLAIGTGAGAAVGGLIGGKKGAAIGALSGLGGSALYTYKLRKRSPRY
jgi:hypothetical protein